MDLEKEGNIDGVSDRDMSAHDERKMLAENPSATLWSNMHPITMPPHFNSVTYMFSVDINVITRFLEGKSLWQIIYIYIYISSNENANFLRECDELFRCTKSYMIHIQKSTYKIIYDYWLTRLCRESLVSHFFSVSGESYMILYIKKTLRILLKS